MSGKFMTEREVLKELAEEARKKGQATSGVFVELSWNRFEQYGETIPSHREDLLKKRQVGAGELKVNRGRKIFIVQSEDNEIYHPCPRCGEPVNRESKICVRCSNLDYCVNRGRVAVMA